MLSKRSTLQHLALVAVKGEVMDVPYERVSEAFGHENHPHILHALKEGNSILRCRALEALASVLTLPQELVQYMKFGLLELVVDLIADDVESVKLVEMNKGELNTQKLAARVLGVITMSVCAQKEILKGENIITRIKPVFAAASNKCTCEHLYNAMLNLTGSFTGARHLTSVGYLPLVLGHLKSCRLNNALRINALKLLKNLVNDGMTGTTICALELGVVDQCFKQLHSPNFKVRAAACDALAALGFMDKARKAVVEHGEVVPLLCMQLTDTQRLLAAASTGALMSLAAHNEIKRQIVANGGLASVNELLQTKMVSLQLHTTKLIAAVTTLPEARLQLNVPITTHHLKTLIQDENQLLAMSAKVALEAVQRQA